MIPLVEAKRTLACVRLATRLERILTFVIIVAAIVSLFLDGVETFIRVGLWISGFAKCTKYFLYVWLFILTLTVVQFVWHSLDYLYILLTDKCFRDDYFPTNWYVCNSTSADIFLAIVGCVTGLMLTVINLYTFCILDKNGLCFVYSINRDVEQANVSIQISYGSAGTTASASPDETSRILPPSNSVAVNNPEIESGFYGGNDHESLV